MEMRLNQQIKHLYEINRGSLSTQMCIDCIYDLKMSYKFFTQIKRAEKKLASIHSNLSKESLLKNQEKQSCALGNVNLYLYFCIFFLEISKYVICSINKSAIYLNFSKH